MCICNYAYNICTLIIIYNVYNIYIYIYMLCYVASLA